MSVEGIKIEKTIKKIIRKLCNELDVEYIFKLPKSIQTLLFKISADIDTPLARFYHQFLKYNNSPTFDFFDMVDCQLHIDESIEIENIEKYIPLDLETKKAIANDEIDVFHKNDPKKIYFYNTCTAFLDQFKHYMKKEQYEKRQTKNFTNAWIKCWEMVHFYHLIPKNHSDDFTVFCNAEFPGAFIFAINHYIKTETSNKKYKWYANSLWPGKEDDRDDNILGDSFELYKKYRDHWLMNGKDASGNVTDPDMIRIITEKLGKKVDLYTSDIGIGIPYDQANNQESLEAHLNLGQVICALRTLKEGGSMVCKTFMFFKPMTISLLYLLTNVFTEFSVSKPMTSRPANAEIYLIGRGYRCDEKVTNKLEELLFDWNIEKMNEWIIPVTRYFYLQIVYSLYYLYQRQTYFVEKNLEFVKHEYDMSKTPPTIMQIFARKGTSDPNYKELLLRQKMVNIWKEKYPIKRISEHDKL